MNIPSLSIDNLAFAKKGEQMSGEIAIASCKRLLDLLQSQAPAQKKSAADVFETSTIEFSLAGEVDVQGRCFVRMEVNAVLNTYCQRCLESVSLPLRLNFRYLIADDLNEPADGSSIDDTDEYDLQEPDNAMDVIALVEDELIMALPIAPAHDFDCVQMVMQSGDKPNPFALLKGLIKS